MDWSWGPVSDWALHFGVVRHSRHSFCLLSCCPSFPFLSFALSCLCYQIHDEIPFMLNHGQSNLNDAWVMDPSHLPEIYALPSSSSSSLSGGATVRSGQVVDLLEVRLRKGDLNFKVNFIK